jgi:hypothetical protein
MGSATAVERGLVVADAGDRAAEVEDRECGQRGGHARGMLGDDVDDGIGQCVQVARPDVVPPALGERGVEHRLVLDERLGHAQVEQRGTELPHRQDDLLALVDRSRVAADHRDDGHAAQLRRDGLDRRRHPVDDDGGELVRHIGDPLAIEPQHVGRPLHRPDDRAGEHLGPDRIEPELELGDDPEVPAAASEPQNRSAFSRSLARTSSPLAVTTSAATS